MSKARILTGIVVLAIAQCLSGCGTPKEKTAPCKRPGSLIGYAGDQRVECGPMRLINPHDYRALAAIDDLARQPE